MIIEATIRNLKDNHIAVVESNGHQTSVDIKSKTTGRGSSINGGELLFLSLATYFCNDIFREAEILDINVNSLEVKVIGEFGGRGEPAKNVSFDVKISDDAPDDQVTELLRLTDSVSEVQNTMRIGVPVTIGKIAIQ